MQKIQARKHEKLVTGLVILVITTLVFAGCKSSPGGGGGYQMPPPELPVFPVIASPATTYQEYSASLEGSKDVEVRPQVDGYLDRIYVDEGAYVRKGQPLFHIDSRVYAEQLNTAKAGLATAKANLTNAEINLAKITPLVQNNVVSDVQLKTAQAAHDAAVANVAQAQSLVQSAQINLGYTTITAPVDGYVGRIPLKTGSLVGRTTAEALTVVSEIKEVYAYFSFSENDFLNFKTRYEGNTIEEKIKKMPPVELVLPDGTTYTEKGKVQTVAGQFDNTTGSISFRAVFPNKDKLLRSGNTGKIRIARELKSALVLPQESTFEVQDKVLVFTVGDSNKVASRPIIVAGKTANYYFVESGLNAGEKVVFTGIGTLQDGMMIVPKPITMDSLLKAKPL